MPSGSAPNEAAADPERADGQAAVVRVSPGQSADAWNETELPDSAELGSGESADSLLREVGALPRRHAWLAELEPERAGQRVGPYEIKEKIGEGGMGIVYAADDTRLRRRVALKVLPAALMGSDDRRRRFLREARSASAVHHANVATIFDVGESEGTVYLAMEFVHGRTLRAYLKEQGVVDVKAAVDIGLQAARGLARAHAAGVIHRDVKPENIMIASDGMVKLLDFGLAKLAKGGDEDAPKAGADESPDQSDELSSHVGTVLGTPAYMSPEQAAGAAVDVRTDVYSMGVVLFEMLTGARPIDGTKSELTFGPEIPAGVAAVIRNCLRTAPADRYADADKLAGALLELTVAKAPRASFGLPLAAMAASGAGLALWLALPSSRAPEQTVQPVSPAESAIVVAPSASPATSATPPAPSAEVQAKVAVQAKVEASAKPSGNVQQTQRETPSSVNAAPSAAPPSSAKQTLQGAVAKDAPF